MILRSILLRPLGPTPYIPRPMTLVILSISVQLDVRFAAIMISDLLRYLPLPFIQQILGVDAGWSDAVADVFARLVLIAFLHLRHDDGDKTGKGAVDQRLDRFVLRHITETWADDVGHQERLRDCGDEMIKGNDEGSRLVRIDRLDLDLFGIFVCIAHAVPTSLASMDGALLIISSARCTRC